VVDVGFQEQNMQAWCVRDSDCLRRAVMAVQIKQAEAKHTCEEILFDLDGVRGARGT
jgi:hypothetical protein